MAQRMVGFDIGEREVKMVCVNGTEIKKAVSLSLPDNMVEKGEINSVDAMADFLRDSAREHGIPKGPAAVILPESLVFCRNIRMPVMSEKNLAYNLSYEFKDYLEQGKEKYFYDYALYGLSEEEEGTSMDLFACATLKSTIADYRAMFRRAGFRLQCVIPEEWAYVSALRACHIRDGLFCFGDLGHSQSRVNILHHGRPVSRRAFAAGVQDLENQISEDCLVDVHVARNYLHADQNGVLASENAQKLYNQLAVEILKTVNFYNYYNNREAALKQVCLCGGGAFIEPLRAAIGSVTGLELLTLGDQLPALKGQELFLRAYGCAVSKIIK